MTNTTMNYLGAHLDTMCGKADVFDTIDEIPYGLPFYKHYTGSVR